MERVFLKSYQDFTTFILSVLFLFSFSGCKSEFASVAKPAAVSSTNSTAPDSLSLNTIADKVFQSTAVTAGATVSLDYDDSLTLSDLAVTYSCTFDTTKNNDVTGGTACTSLPGTPVFSSTAGTLSWITSTKNFGTYEIKVTATKGTAIDSKIIAITVAPNIQTSKLKASLDTMFADLFSAIGSGTSWLDLTTNSFNASVLAGLGLGGGPYWLGSGTTADPYRFDFNAAVYLSLNSNATGNLGSYLVSAWMKPDSPTTAGSVLLSNGGGYGNGFELRQSVTHPGRLEVRHGLSDYHSVVQTHGATTHWKFDETSGASAAESFGTGADGTYSGALGVTYSQGGALRTEGGTAVKLLNGNSYVDFGTNATVRNMFDPGDSWTISMWVKPVTTSSQWYWLASKPFTSHVAPYYQWDLRINSFNRVVATVWHDTVTGALMSSNSVAEIPLNQWSHLMVSYDLANGIIEIYINGVLDITTTVGPISNYTNHATSPFAIGADPNLPTSTTYGFDGMIDDVALFPTALTATEALAQFKSGSDTNVGGATYPAIAQLQDGPLVYLRLGETSGTMAFDKSYNGHNATIAGTPTLGVTGAVVSDTDKAIDLNAVGYVQIADDLGFPDAVSFSFWFNRAAQDGGWKYIADSRASHPGNGAWHAFDTDVLQFWNNSVSIPATAYAAGTWYHVVTTATATATKVYLNGKYYASGPGTTLRGLGAGMVIGSNQWFSQFFNGKLDEFAIYDSELTGEQAYAHYKYSSYRRCLTASALTAGNWYNLAFFLKSGVERFTIDGKAQCAVIPGSDLVAASAESILIGARTGDANHFSGHISDIRVYSDATNAGQYSDAVRNYLATSPKYGANASLSEGTTTVPVTNNIEYFFDAANAASRGLGAHPSTLNDCSNIQTSWASIAGIYTALANLAGFSGTCGTTSGWNGDGSTADQYRLVLDGTNDRITLGKATNLGTIHSAVIWIKNQTNSAVFFGGDSPSNYMIWNATASQLNYYSAPGPDFTVNLGTPINTANWNQIAVTRSAARVTFYLNGVQVGQTGTYPGTELVLESLAAYPDGSYAPNGSLAVAQAYTRELTAAEVLQNCNALKARFGVTCGP